jgi:hypothetical protein
MNKLVFSSCLTMSCLVAQLSYASNDCRQIQSLIDNAKTSSSQVTITVPAGDYTCQEPIFIERDNINLVGAGKVKIKLADNANAPVMVIGSRHTKWMKDPNTGREDFFTVAADGSSQIKTVRNVRVSGFDIDGNKDNQSYECWTPNATTPPRKPGEAISNSTCDGTGPSAIRNNGITIRGAEDIQVSDVILNNNASGGMVTEKHVARLRVQRMKASHNWFDGFAGYQTEHSTIEDSELTNNQGAGASLDLNFNNNTFLRTKLSDNAHQGVFARELSGNKWVDSEISCNGYQGVFLASSHAGEIETAQFRMLSRQMGHDVDADLSLTKAFYRDLIALEQSKPQKRFPLDLVMARAKDEKRAPEDVLAAMYTQDVALKRSRCANGNEFQNTRISCSGTQNAGWGTGLRINDDECAENCIDAGTRAYFESLEGDKRNRAGAITVGTTGLLGVSEMKTCAKESKPSRVDEHKSGSKH